MLVSLAIWPLTTCPFRAGAAFLLLTETPSTFGCSLRFFHIRYLETVSLSYPHPVSPSEATTYLLGYRSFSRYSLVYQTLPCHISLISSSPPLTHPVAPCIYFTFSHYLSPTLHCCATRAHMCIHALLLPTTGIPWYLFLAGRSRSPTRNRSLIFFAYSIGPGRENTFLFPHSSSTPRISLKCFSYFTLFLRANLSLSSIFYFTSVLYPPKLSICSTGISSWSPPNPFHIVSTTLSRLT